MQQKLGHLSIAGGHVELQSYSAKLFIISSVGWGVVQLSKHVPSIHEILGLIPSTGQGGV